MVNGILKYINFKTVQNVDNFKNCSQNELGRNYRKPMKQRTHTIQIFLSDLWFATFSPCVCHVCSFSFSFSLNRAKGFDFDKVISQASLPWLAILLLYLKIHHHTENLRSGKWICMGLLGTFMFDISVEGPLILLCLWENNIYPLIYCQKLLNVNV